MAVLEMYRAAWRALAPRGAARRAEAEASAAACSGADPRAGSGQSKPFAPRQGPAAQQADAAARRSAEAVAASLAQDLHPRRVVEFACGEGWLLEALRGHGAEGIGYDWRPEAIERARARRLDVRRLEHASLEVAQADADVAVSLRLAERLATDAGDELLDLLISAAPSVVFAAPRPRGGGCDARAQAPWAARFLARGYRYEADLTLGWRRAWLRAGVDAGLIASVMLFRGTSPRT